MTGDFTFRISARHARRERSGLFDQRKQQTIEFFWRNVHGLVIGLACYLLKGLLRREVHSIPHNVRSRR